MKFCMYNLTTTIKIGGVETFYWEVSKVLKQKNYDIEIISGKGKYIKYNDLKITQFSYIPRENIIDLGNRFRKWCERVSFFKNAYPYLKKQNFDIFLIHKPLDFFAAYFMKKNNPNIKTVFISGGEDFYGFDKYFAKYIDIMISVSKDNAKKIEQRYKRKVFIVPNGVNTERFKFDKNAKELLRKKFNLENKKVLISVGRIVGWKGYQLIIKALKDLKDYYYICIGNGEYLDELKNLAVNLSVKDRVLFLGTIDNKVLPKYLSMGDIFIQPSIGNEAFGITVIEAMSCDLPVVASKNGGMLDIIKNGKNGYLFENNNIKDMIEKIKWVDKNKESLNPRYYVEQNFTWKKTVNNLLKKLHEN